MSWVTNVILSVEIGTNISKVQEYLKPRTLAQLAKVDHYGGGDKAMEVDLYIGAFDYLILDDLIAVVETLSGDLTFMVQEQDDENFRIIHKETT